MGCGASTPSPPGSSLTSKPSPPTVELILVLGIDEAAGRSELCEKLCGSLRESGRTCQHLNHPALLKAEVAAETEAGLEIASLTGQGKIVPAALSARVIKSSVLASPLGVCILDGYPPSEAALKTMADEIGHAPRLALLIDLPEDAAKAKLIAAGHDEESAQQRCMLFKAQSKGLIDELERRSILHKVDGTKPLAEQLGAARALLDSVTRGTVSGGSSSSSAAESSNALGERVVLVMGAPGAGKATQCAKLAAKYGCAHLQLEQLMRSEVREETATGRAIAEMVKGGKIVPAHLYLALLKGAMAKLPDQAKPCLVDGFPRSVDALALLEEHMGPCKRTLLLEATDTVLTRRLLEGAKDAGRPEDEDAAKRKIRTFKNQTHPAIASLQARGLVSKVDASGSQDDVFKRLCKAYESLGLH